MIYVAATLGVLAGGLLLLLGVLVLVRAMRAWSVDFQDLKTERALARQTNPNAAAAPRWWRDMNHNKPVMIIGAVLSLVGAKLIALCLWWMLP
jgi:hypothetical protein